MKILIEDRKLSKIIDDKKKLVKKYGPENAKLLTMRFDQLKATDNLGLALQFKIGRCHALTGNYKGCYALDLDHPDRLIIRPVNDKDIDLSNIKNLALIDTIEVVEVVDYHGK
ncbi:plasmid maintenance system killer protein [Paraclostridium bifermentans]|uniref:plasmid maintenance system killer protein n=1 Tax=Paraclostridium bifermentans TaxID=1490 RepID=UPI001159D1EE|nr:plasmid maintenance system killer protein [Paraclostridium bifermentans]MCE9674427.1 hypothetical protein [Paraclostridium bifermentans]TQO58105.1 plasmid maintenance system killer protein [Paraclostridium bifermentans]